MKPLADDIPWYRHFPTTETFHADIWFSAQRSLAGHHRSASQADDIEFEINGAEMQFAEIKLDPGESVVAEAGVTAGCSSTLAPRSSSAS